MQDMNTWFDNYARQAWASGDSTKKSLVNPAYEGWRYRAVADGENALRAFEEGIKIAKALNEPCWEAYYQYWAATIHLFNFYDYQKALDSAIRLVTELRKAQYADCPVRRDSADFLAKVYCLIDFLGYEDEIVALLDYLDNEVAGDNEIFLQVLVKRAELDIAHARYDAAREKLHQIMNHKPNNDFRLYDAYGLLRKVDFAEGDLSMALSLCRTAQKYAWRMSIQDCIGLEKLWEALLLKYQGDEQAASQLYYPAIAHYEQYKIPLENEYYTAITQYLELDNQPEAALRASEALLAIVKPKMSILNQMDAYFLHIGLLGRLGKDVSETLAEAKLVAQTSRKAERYLARLAQFEAGNYFDYEWQKARRKN